MKQVFIFVGLPLGLSAVTGDVLSDCGLKADGGEMNLHIRCNTGR